jgi:hypothetical protein
LDSRSFDTCLVLGAITVADIVISDESKVAFTAAKKAAEFVRVSTTYFSLSITTSLTTSTLAAIRILLMQRASRKAGLQQNTAYSRVAEVVIESAILYSVPLLLYVVLEAVRNNAFYYAQNIHGQTTVRDISFH